MEFTIDFALVRKIVAQEYAQARTEIAELGAVPAHRRSLERHDDRLAQAGDAASLACRAGCSWCCHFSVDVRPVEVFNILEFMEQELSPQELQRVREEITVNSAALSQLSELERVQRNIKCPFLNAGSCTIYAARPQTCRNYHATDVTGCQKSFAEPDNLDIDPDYAPLVFQTGGAHVDAFSKAMRDSGYGIEAFEMNTALAAAMEDRERMHQQFNAQAPVFIDLQSSEVTLDFVDMTE